MSITLRMSDAQTAAVKEFAALYGMTVSEFIKTAVFERIEDEYDIKIGEQTLAELKQDPVVYTHEEVGKLLGLK